jgi:hypothetical protein
MPPHEVDGHESREDHRTQLNETQEEVDLFRDLLLLHFGSRLCFVLCDSVKRVVDDVSCEVWRLESGEPTRIVTSMG